MSHFPEKYFMGHLGHWMYCYVLYKAYCGGFGGAYKLILKCHILCHIVGHICLNQDFQDFRIFKIAPLFFNFNIRS
jgi:hypothetical protein